MTSFLCFSFRRPDWRHAAVTHREDRDMEREGKCNGRSQTRYEWGKLSKKERERKRKERRWITHNRREEERDRVWRRWSEGMVIDCLVSPHAPVTSLIGVAKTKKRDVSVTSEPFQRGSSCQAPARRVFLLLPLNYAEQCESCRERRCFIPLEEFRIGPLHKQKAKYVQCCWVFFTHQAFRVMSSFKYRTKTEQKTFPKHALRYWFT